MNSLREQLIASLHSDKEAESFFTERLNDSKLLLELCNICAPHDEYSNDPRMAAAYYISQYPAELLAEVIPLLLVLVTLPSCGGEDMNGNIASHLLAAINKSKHLYSAKIYQNLGEIAQEYGVEVNG
ncbi:MULTISPECIES: hypothetical protein [unclassified Agarivorans]|uniref:hypothetical protein n=1 Tax=unclassified Agarivorans TaxID=2636026 RepID=UPI0026E286AC|nr:MULTISPECIES: hypothetical protein [unclassified Agarivorans]MDO6687502.1 hypothetical protein [Agarivorans sp. 3_MG-2023]MDO6717165.1 hypothetical protein [Agarivorans sp. 2_MG-2023]